MAIDIPSPVLARLQILFQSGASLEEVAEALDLDLQQGQPAFPSPPLRRGRPAAAGAPAGHVD